MYNIQKRSKVKLKWILQSARNVTFIPFVKQKTVPTSLTAPELEVHIAFVFARPTVGPLKSTPLNEEKTKCLDTNSNTT